MKPILLLLLTLAAHIHGATLPPPSYLGSGATGGLINAGSPAFYTNGGYGRGNNSPEITFNYDFDASSPNNIRFDGVPFEQVAWGSPFLMGYLTYTNGRWWIRPELMMLSLQTVENPPNPGPLAGPPDTLTFTQSGQYLLTLIVTPNTEGLTEEQKADILYFQPVSGGSVSGAMGSLRVYEGQSATVELWGTFGSLNLLGFGTVTSNPGSAFVYNSCTDCLIPANFQPAGNTGNSTFIPPAPTSVVPEPGTFGLLAAALAGAGVRAGRTRSRRSALHNTAVS